jgi:hypothetical protein
MKETGLCKTPRPEAHPKALRAAPNGHLPVGIVEGGAVLRLDIPGVQWQWLNSRSITAAASWKPFPGHRS